jgi:hypothetical protein
MNTKTAKRLRRESRYHPDMPRQYHTVNKSRKIKDVKTREMKLGTQELIDSDPRVLYKELKREYYES